MDTERAVEGVLPREIPCSEEHAPQIVFKLELGLGEVLADLVEELLIVDLHISISTSVCLACCHQSQVV
jgi:hypothetical protein